MIRAASRAARDRASSSGLGYCRSVTGVSPAGDRIAAAEVIAALSLATDLGLGIDLEHGLRSTLFAMRLAERLGVDREVAVQTYYACLLVHVGCTTNAHVAAEVFGDGSEVLSRNLLPVLFGSQREMTSALLRSVAPGQPLGACRGDRADGSEGGPRPIGDQRSRAALRGGTDVGAATRSGSFDSGAVRTSSGALGRQGRPAPGATDEIPLAMRIAHVARDADLRTGAAVSSLRSALSATGGGRRPGDRRVLCRHRRRDRRARRWR